MKVKLFANLRLIAGTSMLEVQGNCRVGQLLSKLAEEYGEKFRKLIFGDDGNVLSGVIVLVNGMNIFYLKGLDTTVGERDEVSLFPPIGGG